MAKEVWVRTGLKECPNCGLVVKADACYCPECYSPELADIVCKSWVYSEPSVEMEV